MSWLLSLNGVLAEDRDPQAGAWGPTGWRRERGPGTNPGLLCTRWLAGEYRLEIGHQGVDGLEEQEDGDVVVNESLTELGHRVWDTSPCMAKFFQKNSSLLRGKRVLELGSGTGLLVRDTQS